MKLLFAAAIFCALPGLAMCSAYAEDTKGPARPTPVSIEVDASGLDLSKPLGVSRLTDRIRSTMVDVCGRQPPALPFERSKAYRQCVGRLSTPSTNPQHVAAFAAALRTLD